MAKGQDLSHIYSLRSNFSIIALTGRTCSGASTVASLLENGFDDGSSFPDPFSYGYDNDKKTFTHNAYRKYRIIYEYAKTNFDPYILIKYREILTLFIIEHGLQEFINFLESSELKKEFLIFQSKLRQPSFENEIKEIKNLKSRWEDISKKLKNIDVKSVIDKGQQLEFVQFYFGDEFIKFSADLDSILSQESILKRNKVLQIFANNLRRAGNPYDFITTSTDHIFTVVEVINILIKCCRKNKPEQTQVVIDSLRNSLEIMFFKQRFAAFYTIAVNREDSQRDYWTRHKFTNDSFEDVDKFINDEYSGAKDIDFYKPNVQACLQQADIHIAFMSDEEAKKKNAEVIKNSSEKSDSTDEAKDNSSPYHSWEVQILKYVSLISYPGLIPPSPEERCMQLAYTAKHNSGCISRHVGAAITDEFYSIKAIGWNNTPEGLVPCSLRNVNDLISHTRDYSAFTTYEKKIEDVVKNNFENHIEENKELLKGRNVCFCFKSLQNSIAEGKNQVHTRSLHAEESAFLQLTKYGGTGILGGKLFTTASPCELCAKKAYQLGIRVIYYIDPYPGISLEHILSAGNNPIEMRLFNGAIGNAYHWLYDPIMPYKNELTLLLNNEVKDLASQYKEQVKLKDNKIQELETELNQLKAAAGK